MFPGEEKHISGMEEDGLQAAIDMGDLVGLTINNEAEISYDVSSVFVLCVCVVGDELISTC